MESSSDHECPEMSLFGLGALDYRQSEPSWKRAACLWRRGWPIEELIFRDAVSLARGRPPALTLHMRGPEVPIVGPPRG